MLAAGALAAGALAALPAGLLMDRFGRVPVLAGGFARGICGCALAALGNARRGAGPVNAACGLVAGRRGYSSAGPQ